MEVHQEILHQEILHQEMTCTAVYTEPPSGCEIVHRAVHSREHGEVKVYVYLCGALEHFTGGSEFIVHILKI